MPGQRAALQGAKMLQVGLAPVYQHVDDEPVVALQMSQQLADCVQAQRLGGQGTIIDHDGHVRLLKRVTAPRRDDARLLAKRPSVAIDRPLFEP